MKKFIIDIGDKFSGRTITVEGYDVKQIYQQVKSEISKNHYSMEAIIQIRDDNDIFYYTAKEGFING